ncbi:MAG: 4Fe-4S binding protein, partial [Limnochordia bacterium]|nr:4Fe-4S binding protein [Limnochordia bacterium]
MLRVNYEKCNLCGRCMEVCPFGGIGIMADQVIINEKCRLCRQCIKHCPTGALSLSKSTKGLVNDAEWQGVLVFAEQSGGVIHPVTYELIGKGRELAKKLGQPLNCVLIGYKVRGKAAELLKYGVEKVYVYDYPELEYYSIEPF